MLSEGPLRGHEVLAIIVSVHQAQQLMDEAPPYRDRRSDLGLVHGRSAVSLRHPAGGHWLAPNQESEGKPDRAVDLSENFILQLGASLRRARHSFGLWEAWPLGQCWALYYCEV